MSLIKGLSTKQKVDLLKELYHDIASKGQDGDTMLAHINPEEAMLLRAYGGSGTINPYTGLPEYKKAVKTIAKVAAVAAAAYYGGQYFAANFGATAGATAGVNYAGATHLGSMGIASGVHSLGAQAGLAAGAGLFSATAIQRGGLLLQGVSYLQQRKAISAQQSALKSQAEEQRRVNLIQERYREAVERRQRYAIQEQGRSQMGLMTAKTAAAGGLSLSGTSGYIGSTGAVQSGTIANLDAINAASGASTAISEGNQRAADYGTKANMAYGTQQAWANVGTFGGNLFKYSDKYADAGNALFSIFKI